jgi:hypothetical protein
LVSSKKEYLITQSWKDKYSDSFLYRVAVNGVELGSTIRVPATQKVTHGEAVLLGWCRRHVDELREYKVVDVDLNEEVIR